MPKSNSVPCAAGEKRKEPSRNRLKRKTKRKDRKKSCFSRSDCGQTRQLSSTRRAIKGEEGKRTPSSLCSFCREKQTGGKRVSLPRSLMIIPCPSKRKRTSPPFLLQKKTPILHHYPSSINPCHRAFPSPTSISSWDKRRAGLLIVGKSVIATSLPSAGRSVGITRAPLLRKHQKPRTYEPKRPSKGEKREIVHATT